ncbi:putative required for hyphal anastomosis (HAM-2) protein [Rutstroemia sp. NJR-2017a WRK4]|nr:putative required for hyphal anastomosis (HAM-2) protein [Rutstroemia sp. NJR-2017a WRK4]
MSSLWTKSSTGDATPKDTADVADTGLADVGLPSPAPDPPTSVPMARPQLQRHQPQPPPPHQPPPPPAPQQQQQQMLGNPTDSLSLMQLKKLVTEFPKIDPTSYTFVYADTASFEEEIDEWFSYNEAEFKRLNRAKDTFGRRWKKFSEKSWPETDREQRLIFLKKEIEGMRAVDLRRRCKSLQTILHVVLGIWDETAGKKEELDATSSKKPKNKTKATPSQIEYMKENLLLLAESGGIEVVYDVTQNAFKYLWDDDVRETKLTEEDVPFVQDELDNVMTIFYLIIEGIRFHKDDMKDAREKLSKLEPSLVEFLLTITGKLRWDEANELPQTRVSIPRIIFLLFWKAILLVFGGTNEIDNVKRATDELANSAGEKIITASPLDYHIFRQEITSKYPAYIPPEPLIPLEPDNNSILPPLPNRPSRASTSGILNPPNANSGGASILHQPVHIATPAPSPPPSPPVGGKAGKKQNYQTNQNFPFMYPPLDSTSNSAGGKGTAGLQDLLVGRKWEGSDIPKSILEAGELFAGRMRMTRAMRQLWDERERFLKFERGWDDPDDEDIEELDLDHILAGGPKFEKKKRPALDVDYGPRGDISAEVKEKLDMIESFYQHSLPHLQSLVIVLLKAVLANVTAILTQSVNVQPQSGIPIGPRTNGAPGQNRQADPANVPLPNPIDLADLSVDEIEAMRFREITSKAVTGILLILLKWFKVSHSNYIPLILKMFAHQEIDRVVVSRTDREELSFFAFCNANSKNVPSPPEPESEDDAAPPPIKMQRETKAAASNDQLPALAFQEGQHAARRDVPEVDELGNPTTEASPAPETEYSWRNFFSSINFLRIMQKICKNKAHRNLLLVQYKSSNIFKKSLKVPQPELRLYTLKLFKNQVPYCGRKWRQGNMRVITAVYLHCRPELRDDWLAGGDVDSEVEEALPLEQALRALTHWFNVRRYPESMGADTKLLEEEHDFFMRELEGMEASFDEMVMNGLRNGDESMNGSMWGDGSVW